MFQSGNVAELEFIVEFVFDFQSFATTRDEARFIHRKRCLNRQHRCGVLILNAVYHMGGRSFILRMVW